MSVIPHSTPSPVCPIRAVVFDLAGTIVDYGSCAPAGVFVELFRRHGVAVSIAEAREPMGLQKRDHILTMLSQTGIARRWQDTHDRPWTQADIDAMYRDFIPLQMEQLPHHSRIIDGVLELTETLRRNGVKIATTTGYNRDMTTVVLAGLKKQGFEPDAALCAQDVSEGRPAPWMIWRALEALRIWPPAAVLNLGDTLPDIASGLNAGAWSAGVVRHGNEIGRPADQVAAMAPAELQSLMDRARRKMIEAGAHFVLDEISDTWDVIDRIDRSARVH